MLKLWQKTTYTWTIFRVKIYHQPMVKLLGFLLLFCLQRGNAALPSFASAVFSMYAIDSSSGQVLIDEHSELSLIPASCIKIVTTATALLLLTPDAQFQTQLEYDGIINQQGTLEGNLYIRGGGDPCLGSSRVPPSLGWKEQLLLWAQAVHERGIRSIAGRIIGDATLWEESLVLPGWAYEDVGNYYGIGASALTFHENLYSLTFEPGTAQGDKTNILRTEPPLSRLQFLNEVTTGAKGSGDRACIYGSEFSYKKRVSGTVPSGVEEFHIKGAMPNPAESCASLLKTVLTQRGIPVLDKEYTEVEPRTPFHTTYSPPIKEIISWTNKRSVNLYAEHLLKELGSGSTAAGIYVIKDFWKKAGVNLKGFHMEDGSGLSRQNCLTTKQLVEILLYVKKSPRFPIFLHSLPTVCGCKAKSGAMALIRGYAGFKGNVIFAVLVNQNLDPDIKRKLEDVLIDLPQQASPPSQ